MNFYERYAKVCADSGIDPCSQKAADMFGITRATISSWNKKNTAPKGETVAAVADALGVSSDYLLGRTEDKTDYSNPDLIAELSGPVLDYFDGDVKKAADFHSAVDADVKREQAPKILQLYNRLDENDKIRVEAYIEGILTNDKYGSKEKLG
jgi:transcriptional regulator with XRE-family HTH domain